MSGWVRHSIWFARFVLGGAALLFTAIALRGLFDPVGSSAVHEITLGSPAGVTVARVGFGAFPLAFAIILLGCVVAERRLLTGLAALVVVAIALTAARLLGLVLDGAAPFTVHVLKPEVGLIVASALALVLELERRRRQTAEAADRPNVHGLAKVTDPPGPISHGEVT
jgi:hypothetical protein